jgi:hypothetical protein
MNNVEQTYGRGGTSANKKQPTFDIAANRWLLTREWRGAPVAIRP